MQDVLAANGEYGLLEGKAAALIHPIGMLGLYAVTLYTGPIAAAPAAPACGEESARARVRVCGACACNHATDQRALTTCFDHVL